MTEYQKSKAICVICQIHLDQIDSVVFLCPSCKRKYIGEYEIMSYENSVGTAFDDSQDTIELEGIGAANSPLMMTKKDNNSNADNISILDKEKQKVSDIPIPKYMQNSQTTRVIDYKEE